MRARLTGRFIGWTVAGALVFGGLWFVYHYFDGVARGRAGPVLPILIQEYSAAIGVIPVFLFLAWLVPRYPITRATWTARLSGYAALALCFGVLHTLWMLVSRTGLYALAGLPAYEYGHLGLRMLMELPNQLITQGAVLGLLHFAHYHRTTRDRELISAMLQTRLAQAELAVLQSQLHPHFLFNTLNAISSLMYDDPASADRMMSELSDLLRQTLSRHATEIPLREELAWLRQYVSIMQIRFRGRLDVRFDTPDDLGPVKVPPLVLQPLLENSVKHSLATRPGPTCIAVQARRRNGRLQLTVADDGPGLAPDHQPGVGIGNTRQRLQYRYGDAASLIVENGPGGGCLATLMLPVEDA